MGKDMNRKDFMKRFLGIPALLGGVVSAASASEGIIEQIQVDGYKFRLSQAVQGGRYKLEAISEKGIKEAALYYSSIKNFGDNRCYPTEKHEVFVDENGHIQARKVRENVGGLEVELTRNSKGYVLQVGQRGFTDYGHFFFDSTADFGRMNYVTKQGHSITLDPIEGIKFRKAH